MPKGRLLPSLAVILAVASVAVADNWPRFRGPNGTGISVDKNVLVHGAGVVAQRALTAGLLDELEIHLVPILMGEGRRLFEHLGVEQRSLERIRVLEGEGGVTHLRYRVER